MSDRSVDIQSIRDFREIPGVTAEEIAKVEALQQTTDYFTYGHLIQTEAFPLPDGSYSGFTIRFSELLSELFGIPFRTIAYSDWSLLKPDVDAGRVDFTGGLTATEERLETYHMSDSIAERSLRLYYLSERYNFTTETDVDGRALGFFRDTINADFIRATYPFLDFTELSFNSIPEAIEMLRNGELDAIVADAVMDPSFAIYEGIKSTKLFPLVYTPVSLTTVRDEYAVIVDILTKYIRAGGIDVLDDLYNKGEQDYNSYKLLDGFSEEELAYIAAHSGDNAVPVAFEVDNYPVSFYNMQAKEYQGIAIDLLAEISRLTKLRFVSSLPRDATWQQLLDALSAGQVAMVTELLPTAERQGHYLWPAKPYIRSHYALLSAIDYPEVTAHRIARSRVGVLDGSGYESLYRSVFPYFDNLTAYSSNEEAFAAMDRGELDLVMATEILLLTQTNYREKAGYKVAFSFNHSSESYFGFNIDESVLCSIVSKAQDYLDMEGIANAWLNRSFDYEKKLAEQRSLFLVIILAVLVITLVFVILMLYRNKQSEERAKIASHAKSNFLAHMSHEIRTPLNAIIGLSEIAKNNTAEPRTLEKNLAQILSSSRYLLGVLNDVLDMSKIESGKLELTREPFRLSEAQSEVEDLIRQRCAEKNIRFLTVRAQSEGDLVLGDKLRLSQVLVNLLGNAAKFTDEGGEVRFRTELLGEDADSLRLRFSVEDTGIGMSEAQVAKLFTPFEQTDNSVAIRYGGTGLGLSISQSLVRSMGGEIKVRSVYGEGSVFYFELTFPKTGEGPDGQTEQRIPELQGRRILLAEDIEVNRFIICELLKPTHAIVEEAEDGLQAIRMFEESPEGYYALAILDIQMPGADGYEVAVHIRGLPRSDAATIPIVAMTANAFKEDVAKALEMGMNGHLAKPVESEAIMETLNRLLPDG